MSNVIILKTPSIASNKLVPSYEPQFTSFPDAFSQFYDNFIYNQASSNLCILLSIYEFILLQNPNTTILPKDEVNVMKLCSNIYKYNKLQGKRDTIYNFILAFNEYLHYNAITTNLSQCKDIDSIKDAIIHNRGIILNIPLSYALENYDKDYKININKNTIYNLYNHSVLAIGYEYIDEQLYLEIVNSYGSLYGNEGKVLLPIDYPMIEYPYTFNSIIKE